MSFAAALLLVIVLCITWALTAQWLLGRLGAPPFVQWLACTVGGVLIGWCCGAFL